MDTAQARPADPAERQFEMFRRMGERAVTELFFRRAPGGEARNRAAWIHGAAGWVLARHGDDLARPQPPLTAEVTVRLRLRDRLRLLFVGELSLTSRVLLIAPGTLQVHRATIALACRGRELDAEVVQPEQPNAESAPPAPVESPPGVPVDAVLWGGVAEGVRVNAVHGDELSFPAPKGGHHVYRRTDEVEDGRVVFRFAEHRPASAEAAPPPLTEGHAKKGGVGDVPELPRPDVQPAGQGAPPAGGCGR